MDYVKDFSVTGHYLNFPVKTGAQKCLVSFKSDGKKVREFKVELAEGEPDFWTFSDISEFMGLTLEMHIEGFAGEQRILAAIELSSQIEDGTDVYREKSRPQFHFSSRRGWLNDPNGLLYYKGEYHLFYQHNPYGWNWDNMHWGHAISTDLIHWQELADALYPDEMGDMWSGSGVVDVGNSAGLQIGKEKTLVLFYTCAGGKSRWSEEKLFTQCLAFSNDEGRTWVKYQGNPVVPYLIGGNRDPKVIWHDPSKHWIMALFLDKNNYALMISTDLKRWEKSCDVEIPGGRECPDFFELAVDGDTCRKWVFWVANGRYLIGSFDGRVFQPESAVLQSHQGNHFYAAQTWSNIPEYDGRRIQIGWATLDLPGMPFNKFMTFPTELTLRNTEEGIRLFVNPVREIEKLHEKKLIQTAGEMGEGEKSLAAIQGELLDIQIEIDIGAASCISLIIRGVEISYHPQTQQLTCLDKAANLDPINGKIKLRILVDRTSIEIFGNNGRVYMPMGVILDKADPSLAIGVTGGEARVASLEIYQLKSIW